MTRLALVMIVRNEARALARSLASVRAHVDQIIVLDTGSTDATESIARQHGARVEHFTWCDDFAAARNAALDLSSADWNLVLDGDEWLDGPADALGAASLPSAAAGTRAAIGLVCIANTFDLAGATEQALSWVPRVLPRGVRYAGRIHEQPISALPRRRLPLRIGHDGHHRERLAEKSGRNAALLRQALLTTPDDAYLLFQMGKDREIYEEYAEAVPFYEQALLRAAPNDRFRHDLLVRTLFTLKRAQRHEQAILLADREQANWQDSPDFFFALGDVLLDWAVRNPDTAVAQWLPMAQACWQRCLQIGERPLLEGAVQGRGSFLAAHNLAVVHAGLGGHDRAAHYQALAAELRGQVARQAAPTLTACTG